MGEGEFDTALAELERAIEINPNCSLAYGSLGTALNFAGRPEESIANNEIAIRSNPLDPSIFFRYSGLAISYFLLDQCETAVEWARKSVRQKPDWFQGHAILAAGYARLNRTEEARAALAEYRSNFPSASISDFLRIPFRNQEHGERLAAALRKAGLPE
jgi:tetratricopeptide (TPR) repeat protein